MKKLLLALSLMFTLALSAQPAKAWFYIDYPDGNWAEDYALGGGNHAFLFFNWQAGNTDLDIFSLHASPGGGPINLSIGGATPGMGYWFDYSYYSGGYFYYDGYYTNNYGANWYYVGLFYY